MADDYYSFVEPFGHNSNHSKLERYWQSFDGCFGLSTERIDQFDPYASMSRSPVSYILSPFSIAQDLPGNEWIDQAFEAFVRNEIVQLDTSYPQKFGPVISSEIQVSDEFLLDFLQNSEWENIVQVELPKNGSSMEMAKCIYNLLCNPSIGSSKNKRNNDITTFATHVLPLIEKRKRLLFVLPGFPFKDQNRFRVPYGSECVDFSEISFLIRLHNLIQTLYQVHPFGAESLVLSDCHLYKDIFYVSEEQVNEYQWRLNYYRNRLNLQGGVSIIDLKEMIERADSNGVISSVVSHIEQHLKSNYLDSPMFYSLVQGMKWNMNSKLLLDFLDDSDAWLVIKEHREKIPERLKDCWDDYNSKAQYSALKYASINLMLKWTDLIHKFFPESIRCTVHPKKGQFALAMNYAWNGVAWSEKWPRSLQDISTVPYYTLGEQETVYLVKMHSTNYPCFFTKERNDRVLECARKVLKRDGWNVEEFFGREFSIYDSMMLYNLGEDDPQFAWERTAMSKDYYNALLQFRINHYKKYGFGVHAIFKDGVFIGQMGLQVLDERTNQLEFVIFLGQQYTGQGIGTKLLKYLFKRCKDEGINDIYGVIRNNNPVASTVVQKFGGKALKTMAHYHQSGVLYKIEL